MKLKIKIRPAKITDLKNLLAIGKKHFGQEKWLDMKFLEDSLLSIGYHFIAEYNKNIIGGILVTRYDFPKNWIYYFVVHPDYQRLSIGSKLLKEVEKNITKNLPKKDYLYVDIGENDEVAKNFYFKNGFKVLGRVKNWFDENIPGLILGKKLN